MALARIAAGADTAAALAASAGEKVMGDFAHMISQETMEAVSVGREMAARMTPVRFFEFSVI